MEESGIISKEKGKQMSDLQIERYKKILIEIFIFLLDNFLLLLQICIFDVNIYPI